MRCLFNDIHALELMLAEENMIESDVRHIGAEQEMFLVDRNWRPACVAVELLEAQPIESFRRLVDEELARATVAIAGGIDAGAYYEHLVQTGEPRFDPTPSP